MECIQRMLSVGRLIHGTDMGGGTDGGLRWHEERRDAPRGTGEAAQREYGRGSGCIVSQSVGEGEKCDVRKRRNEIPKRGRDMSWMVASIESVSNGLNSF